MDNSSHNTALLIKLTALGKGLRGVCIADSKQIVALCTAIKIVADSLDKILR